MLLRETPHGMHCWPPLQLGLPFRPDRSARLVPAAGRSACRGSLLVQHTYPLPCRRPRPLCVCCRPCSILQMRWSVHGHGCALFLLWYPVGSDRTAHTPSHDLWLQSWSPIAVGGAALSSAHLPSTTVCTSQIGHTIPSYPPQSALVFLLAQRLNLCVLARHSCQVGLPLIEAVHILAAPEAAEVALDTGCTGIKVALHSSKV